MAHSLRGGRRAQPAAVQFGCREIAEKNRQAEEKLMTLDAAIMKANAAMEFTMAVMAAQNDDRVAFDLLKKWSEDKTNPFSARAGQAWNTVFESHNEPMYNSDLKVPWAENPCGRGTVSPREIALIS